MRMSRSTVIAVHDKCPRPEVSAEIENWIAAEPKTHFAGKNHLRRIDVSIVNSHDKTIRGVVPDSNRQTFAESQTNAENEALPAQKTR